MNIIRGFFFIFLIIGIMLITLYMISNSVKNNINGNAKIVYKYIPRTLDEEEESPVYVSQIFKAMFEEPSVWINSIKDDYIKHDEVLNKYYISQL